MKRLILLLIITVVGYTLTANAAPKTIVTDGLVSYWNLDRDSIINKTVVDVWGRNDARIVGNPKVIDAHIKQGLKLDGNGDYVELPNVGNFGSRIGPYTFEVWLKTSNKKNWSVIYKVNEPPCGENNTGNGILINAKKVLLKNRGGIELHTKEDWLVLERSEKRGMNGCFTSNISNIHPVSDGNWHHIVYTIREPYERELIELIGLIPIDILPMGFCLIQHLYIDNEQFTKGIGCTSKKNNQPYVAPIFLGAVNDVGTAKVFFEGVFDEVRIYDRALKHSEVTRNYASRIGLNVASVGKLSTVWGALKKSR